MCKRDFFQGLYSARVLCLLALVRALFLLSSLLVLLSFRSFLSCSASYLSIKTSAMIDVSYSASSLSHLPEGPLIWCWLVLAAARRIRASFGINSDDYLRSVGPEQLLGNMAWGLAAQPAVCNGNQWWQPAYTCIIRERMASNP